MICLTDRKAGVIHRNIAIAYKDVGKIDLAIKHLKLALDHDPTDLEPFRILSTIRKFKASDPLVDAMRKLPTASLTDENQVALYFGLAQYFEDQKNYKEAFRTFSLEIRRVGVAYIGGVFSRIVWAVAHSAKI